MGTKKCFVNLSGRLFFALLFFPVYAICQRDTNRCLLNNDSIKYNIIHVSSKYFDDMKKVIPAKDVVFIHFTEAIREFYKKLDHDQWIALLEDKKTDWSVNLLLYSLFQKDAEFIDRETQMQWIKIHKKDDLKYWKKFLKKNLDKIDWSKM